MKQYLLCGAKIYSASVAESPVSKWITPNKKIFPLLERLKVALPVTGSRWERILVFICVPQLIWSFYQELCIAGSFRLNSSGVGERGLESHLQI